MTDGSDDTAAMTVLYDAIIIGGSGGRAGCEDADVAGAEASEDW